MVLNFGTEKMRNDTIALDRRGVGLANEATENHRMNREK